MNVPVPAMTPQETYDALRQGRIVLIDVRENEERAAANIEGSVHAPLSAFPNVTLPEIPESGTVVIHCAKGGRSAKACMFLQAAWQGRASFYNMAGGIEEWVALGLPVERAAPLRTVSGERA